MENSTEARYYDKVWTSVPMPVDYTCSCGIYVHPCVKNPKAIHCRDCYYFVDPDKLSADTSALQNNGA